MVEIIMKKRAGRAGEVGLFVETEIFETEWSSLAVGSEVKAECTTPANLRYLRFFWALVSKIVDNSTDDRFLDREDCRHELLLAARHYKAVHDPLRNKTELRPRSIAGLSADTWIRLLRRCTHVVITNYLPGMEEGALKAEISTMLGMDVFAPQPKGKADVQERKGAPQDARGSDHHAEKAEERGPERVSVQDVRGLASGQQQQGEQGAVEDRPASEPSRTAGPQTEDEYVAACRKWIEKQTDHMKALEYYDGTDQIATRVHLKIKVGINKLLRRELAEHCAKQKGIS